MSLVDNYVLIPYVGGDENAERVRTLNAMLTERLGRAAVGVGFVDVSDHAGGPKHLEVALYALATNYGRSSVVVEAVREVFGDEAQLLVKEQDDERLMFRLGG